MRSDLEVTFRQALVTCHIPFIEEPPIKSPDGKITRPDFGIQMDKEKYFLEITGGAKDTPHKQAQKEIVKAAGLEDHYQVIDENQVAQLEKLRKKVGSLNCNSLSVKQ
jgi:hypothetical protein